MARPNITHIPMYSGHQSDNNYRPGLALWCTMADRRSLLSGKRLRNQHANEPNKEVVACLAASLKKSKASAANKQKHEGTELLLEQNRQSSQSTKRPRVFTPSQREEHDRKYSEPCYPTREANIKAVDDAPNSDTPTIVLDSQEPAQTSLVSNDHAKPKVKGTDKSPEAAKFVKVSQSRSANPSRLTLSPEPKEAFGSGSSGRRDVEPSILTQMVDQATSQEDEGKQRLKRNMLVMRQSMEKFINKQVAALRIPNPKPNLMIKIQTLQRYGAISFSFAAAMHRIRALGNDANHNEHRLPAREIIEQHVKNYLNEKQQFESRSELL